MKIFYLITKSEAGGAQTHVFQLSRHMRSLGHLVAVMAHPGGWLEEEVTKLGARFYPNPHLTNAINPLADIRAAVALKNALSDFRPDLVSCHSTKAGIIGRLAIRNRIPTIFTAHGWGFAEGASLVRRMTVPFAERLAAKFCAKIICVCENDRQLALRHRIAPAEKLITIHNGVETNVPQAALDVAEGAPIAIAFVGRLANPKDPLLLLEAFCGLPNELQRQARIEIIGDGPKRNALARFIADHALTHRVTLRGSLSRQEVLSVLAQARVFALITNYEGFPRSILEAMAVGLPVIASDVGGVKEALTPECGILVPRGDKAAITRALETLLRDPGRIQKMGRAAHERAKALFSLEKMLTATLAVYSDTFGRPAMAMP
jgi:glycosyltransferase involved in cell wall biosynthesis